MTNINECIARKRGWKQTLGGWVRNEQHYEEDPPFRIPFYTTDPVLILELVEDKHIGLWWTGTTWCALIHGINSGNIRCDHDPGTAVALAWLAGEEDK